MKLFSLAKLKLPSLSKWIGIHYRRLFPYLAGGMVVALLLLVFAELTEELLEDELSGFDSAVESIVRSWTGGRWDPVMVGITHVGSGWVQVGLLLGSVALLLRTGHKARALVLTVCLGGGWLLNYALKALFQRSRPALERLVEAGGYSFPSGHAMVSMCFYGMLGYLAWGAWRSRDRAYGALFFAAGLLLAGLIGFSRIYLGVHYASDVVAGFAAGGTWLLSCIGGLAAIRRWGGTEIRR
ncbi:phosphatase PAP2 family protein [Paenibacillus sp. IB182496]|uniref:Phosphatase PAP2 family protein n=1 Tax=Paenibacillus sabuli TaxID=2772509 RepID=A0A927BQN1_9BACL|nr:phosphatase PAP2 family protein [Paenibacillus sabuli]MBD2843774.1 phosphatase PAP2 family protein [Paenibacillus sabuli]